MVNNRIFKISHQTFSYFTSQVDLDEVDSMEKIIEKVVADLRQVLQKHELEILLKILDDSNFHAHGYNFVDVLQSKSAKVFYVCSHCEM
jgi:hypothetical protein